jgi:ribose transport system permease protein
MHAKTGASRKFDDGGQRYALVAAWVAVAVLFTLLRPDTFATTSNVQSIFGSQAVLLVLALGLIIPLTAKDFDLSIASVLSVSAMSVAVLNVQHGWPLLAAVAVAIAAGLVVGTINGALVVFLGVDSFIVTLGTGTVLSGVVLWISGSNTVSGVDSTLVDLVVTERVLGISLGFWYGLVLCVALWWVFEYTPLGRRLLFVGRGRNVSRLSGVRVNRLRLGALIASSVIAAFAGVLYTGTLGGADPSSGSSLLLPAYAAAFLGATAIVPGRLNAWGTFISVYFLVTGITGLQLLGVESFVQQLFYGGALVLAVALSELVRGRRTREEAMATG